LSALCPSIHPSVTAFTLHEVDQIDVIYRKLNGGNCSAVIIIEVFSEQPDKPLGWLLRKHLNRKLTVQGNFSRQNFLFQNTKEKFGGKKSTLQ
jgi:hypothetical protein